VTGQNPAAHAARLLPLQVDRVLRVRRLPVQEDVQVRLRAAEPVLRPVQRGDVLGGERDPARVECGEAGQDRQALHSDGAHLQGVQELQLAAGHSERAGPLECGAPQGHVGQGLRQVQEDSAGAARSARHYQVRWRAFVVTISVLVGNVKFHINLKISIQKY